MKRRSRRLTRAIQLFSVMSLSYTFSHLYIYPLHFYSHTFFLSNGLSQQIYEIHWADIIISILLTRKLWLIEVKFLKASKLLRSTKLIHDLDFFNVCYDLFWGMFFNVLILSIPLFEGFLNSDFILQNYIHSSLLKAITLLKILSPN